LRAEYFFGRKERKAMFEKISYLKSLSAALYVQAGLIESANPNEKSL
jgi:hypothetical protein